MPGRRRRRPTSKPSSIAPTARCCGSASRRARPAGCSRPTSPKTPTAIAARANQQYIDAIAAFAKQAKQYDKVDVPADQRRQLNLLKLSLVMATPADNARAEELTKIDGAARGGLTEKGSGVRTRRRPTPARTSTPSRARSRRSRDEKQLRAAWEGWHAIAADDEARLPAVRRAVEQRRARARVRRYRRDVAREVRHAARRFHRGARSPVGSGAAAVPEAARLRPDEAAPEVRRHRAAGRPDSRASARQLVGAGLDEHLSARRAGRTPTPATRSPIF